MMSRLRANATPSTEDSLDRLFLDCAELEALLTSIKEGIDRLDPGIASGLVTTEHLMNLAFRIEAAEHGMITIAHQISDTATTLVHQQGRPAPAH